MKTTALIVLTVFAIFGIWRLVFAKKVVKIVEEPIINKTSNVMELCIKKLNADENICLKDYAGKKLLLVNVASECGFTKQYADLEKLYETYKDKIVIIGFPCDQFGGQEPGSEEEIATFCSSKFNVTFPMTTKIEVKGKNQHPIYEWLTQKDKNGIDDYNVIWNFNKFLLSEEGQLLGFFGSRVNPMDAAITDFLK